MRFTSAIFSSSIALLIPFYAVSACPPINQSVGTIRYHVSAEQWVTTNSANVMVSINATLDKQGLEKARQQILLNLQQIAKGEWHITRFDRSQDSSGLERLSVDAEARLPQTALSDLRDTAKKVSKPGATYTISQIDFTPSLAEVEQTREKLRNQLYDQAKGELARVNGVYPEQHFKLRSLNFVPSYLPTTEYAKSTRLQAMAMAEPAAAPALPEIQVSNKINMAVLAEFAAEAPTPKVAAAK